MTEHSRDCVSLWGADLTCDCATAKWEHLRERLALAEDLCEQVAADLNVYDSEEIVQKLKAWRAFVEGEK